MPSQSLAINFQAGDIGRIKNQKIKCDFSTLQSYGTSAGRTSTGPSRASCQELKGYVEQPMHAGRKISECLRLTDSASSAAARTSRSIQRTRAPRQLACAAASQRIHDRRPSLDQEDDDLSKEISTLLRQKEPDAQRFLRSAFGPRSWICYLRACLWHLTAPEKEKLINVTLQNVPAARRSKGLSGACPGQSLTARGGRGADQRHT